MRRFTSTLRGQLIALLIGTVAVSQIIVLFVFLMKTENRIDTFEELLIVRNITSIFQKVAPLAADDRSNLLDILSTTDIYFFLSEAPTATEPLENGDLKEAFERQLTDRQVFLRHVHGSIEYAWDFWFTDEWEDCIPYPRPNKFIESCPQRVFSLQLEDSVWLNASTEHEPSEFVVLMPIFLSMLLTLAGVILVTVFAVKRITRPIQDLSRAAEKFGRGEQIGRLEPEGPEELLALTNSFNEMQERITRFVKDRTQMLGAISHDLRTPITSLRIQAEFVENEDLQSKMIKILEDMEKMVGSTLDFARQEDSVAWMENIDVALTLQDLSDQFDNAAYTGENGPVYVLCNEISFKRAMRNLIDNAVKYGERASIDLVMSDRDVLISVRDVGPGVPDGKLEQIFEPFFRLDESRNTESGNVGLGLSIARTIVHKLGGRIWATNLADGLEVTVALPAQTVAHGATG